MKMLVNSCVSDLVTMRSSRKSRAATPQEGEGMILASSEESIEDNREATWLRDLGGKRLSRKRKRTNETKSFHIHSVQKSCVGGATLTCGMHTPYEGEQILCIWITSVLGRRTVGELITRNVFSDRMTMKSHPGDGKFKGVKVVDVRVSDVVPHVGATSHFGLKLRMK